MGTAEFDRGGTAEGGTSIPGAVPSFRICLAERGNVGKKGSRGRLLEGMRPPSQQEQDIDHARRELHSLHFSPGLVSIDNGSHEYRDGVDHIFDVSSVDVQEQSTGSLPRGKRGDYYRSVFEKGVVCAGHECIQRTVWISVSGNTSENEGALWSGEGEVDRWRCV